MKKLKIVVIGTTVGLLAMGLAGAQEKAKGHEYIGAAKCKMCHNTAKQGKMFDIWEASAHAKAFATLASDKAKAIAKEKGIADPQKADACLKCHVSGHGVKAELLGSKHSFEEGVTCENCHGPGGDYWKNKTMKAISDGELDGTTVGLVVPDEKTCKGCHNAESPTAKEFKFDEMWAKIKHAKPAAE